MYKSGEELPLLFFIFDMSISISNHLQYSSIGVDEEKRPLSLTGIKLFQLYVRLKVLKKLSIVVAVCDSLHINALSGQFSNRTTLSEFFAVLKYLT